MTPKKRRRMFVLGAGMLALGGGVGLALLAFQDNISLFRTPSQLLEQPVEAGRRIRLGGLVEEGSVRHETDSVTVHFRVTDLSHDVPVVYRGLLPDLFREKQGVVTEGSFAPDGTFVADQVLAKHDENYMPREVAEALKKTGQWRGDEAKTQ